MKKIIRVLVCLHLCFLTFAFTRVVGWLESTPFSYVTAVVNDLYFGDWNFGFFSDKVGLMAFENYTMHRLDSTKYVFDTKKKFRYFTQAHENYNRFYGLSVYLRKDTTYQDLLTHSVAVRMLNRNRDAVKVDVRLESMQLPSLFEFQKGKVAKPVETYFAEFVAPY